MTTMERGVAHFRLSGESLTRMARDLVVEGRWMMATALLREGLEGMTYDLAYKILAGDLALEGDEHGMTVCDDDATEHKERVAYRYSGLLRGKDHKLYRGYACVVSWGPDDAAYAKRVLGRSQQSVLVDFERSTRWVEQRSHYYADSPEDVLLRLIHPMGGRTLNTLWAVHTEAPPPWLPEPTSDPYTAWLACLRRCPDIRGALDTTVRLGPDGFPCEPVRLPNEVPLATSRQIRVPPAVTPEDPTADRRALLRALAQHYRHGRKLATGLRPLVLREVERSGTEWIRISLGKRGAGFRVAKAPFTMWACRSEAFDPDPAVVRDYQIQAHSGMRWGSAVDSAAHSDWMVSGGFTWFALYQAAQWDPARRLAARFRTAVFRTALREVKDPGANFVLNAGSADVVVGVVVHPGIDEEVPAGSVIAVPNASPDYAVPAMSAGPRGAVLTLDGGALAHLTVVGMEMGFRVIRVHRLPVAGSRVMVYPDGRVITVGAAIEARDW